MRFIDFVELAVFFSWFFGGWAIALILEIYKHHNEAATAVVIWIATWCVLLGIALVVEGGKEKEAEE